MGTYYRGQVFEMTDEFLLGKGGEGNVYSGKWHGKPAAFKTFAFRGNTNDATVVIGNMQKAIEELHELINLQGQIDENQIEKLRTFVLFPLAHFRQTTNNKIFDVFVYPICKGGDLSDYIKNNNPMKDELKEIFLQMAKRNVIIYKTNRKDPDISHFPNDLISSQSTLLF